MMNVPPSGSYQRAFLELAVRCKQLRRVLLAEVPVLEVTRLGRWRLARTAASDQTVYWIGPFLIRVWRQHDLAIRGRREPN